MMSMNQQNQKPPPISLFVHDLIVVIEHISIGDSLGLEIRHAGDHSVGLLYRFVELEGHRHVASVILDRLLEETLQKWSARDEKSEGVELPAKELV